MVKERPEPERFEIELSSNVEEHHGWRHHGVDPPSSPDLASADAVAQGEDREGVFSEPIAEQSKTGGGDQRAVFVVALIVGVVALALGWLIGRAGGSGEVATLDATVPVTTDTEEPELLPGETLPSAATTTTRPRRTTTTTTLAPPAVETVAIDPRLVDVELTLVGSQDRSALVELDLVERTLTRYDVGRSFEPEAMYVGEDWVALLNPGGGSTYLVRDGEPAERTDLGEPWELLWQEGTDRFWRPDWDHEGFYGPSLYEEVDITGELTGATLELPVGTWVERIDPRGGVIVEVTGKHYAISESAVSLIGTGEMLGVSTDIAVWRDCDEQLKCGVFVSDRETGARRGLALDPPLDELPIEPVHGWGLPTQRSAISPDDSMIVVMLPSDDRQLLGLIDLLSGAVIELGETWWMPTYVWSPDARFVFFLGDVAVFGEFAPRELLAYDRVSGEVFPVSSEPLQLDALSARPAGSE